MNADHDHEHSPVNFDRAFGVGIALNIAFVAIEAFYDRKIDSLALLAWGGVLAGRLRPDARHTYGWKRARILAAFMHTRMVPQLVAAFLVLGTMVINRCEFAGGGQLVPMFKGSWINSLDSYVPSTAEWALTTFGAGVTLALHAFGEKLFNLFAAPPVPQASTEARVVHA